MRRYFKHVKVLIPMVVVVVATACSGTLKTGNRISIKGDKWFMNDSVINRGSPAKGLLMNVRMVNAVFEDRGDRLPGEFSDFDAEKNTEEFISRIPEYVSFGVNAFTICVQGGMPGYEGAINTAFNSDGTLREPYMERVGRLIRAADKNSAAVIMSCFYQRQHSHNSALEGREAIMNALSNTVKWIKKNKFGNVVLEVSNEYRHGGYRNWKDGKWLVSTKGQAELMKLAKSIYPQLIICTSGMGDGQLNDSLTAIADYVSVHFNNTMLEDYASRIAGIRKSGKPVLCNEDDKTGKAGASACLLSVMNGCGWGFMHSRVNQTIPFTFGGYADDTATYNMMKKVVTPGFTIDKDLLLQPSVIITYPNDGDIFKKDQNVGIRFSYINPDTTIKSNIRIYANDKEAGVTGTLQKQFRLQLSEEGTIYLRIAVTDEKGNEILRSPGVDIIVKQQ